MIRHFLTRQFLIFLIVGGIAAILHWLARLLLSTIFPFSIAVAIAYVIGMTVAFILNVLYVFPVSDKPRRNQIRDFVIVNLSFFPVVWFASLQVNILLKSLGMVMYTEELAHALAIPLPMLATFLIYKFFAFKEKRYE